MRSSKTESGHGHQACYDINGNLIVSGISVGTAGFSYCYDVSFDHLNNDVKPFMWALHMDGNPLKRTGYLGTKLSSPLIFQGQHINQYFDRRPPHTNNQLDPE